MKKNYTVLFFIAMIFAVNLNFAQVNVVNDPSFEAGTPSNYWVEASTNFGTPLCDYNSCGDCGGPCVAKTGNWFAWFGGITALEIGSLSQSVTIPVGTSANLSFWFKIAVASSVDADDSIYVQIDGNTLWIAKNVDSLTYLNYTEVNIPIDAYANGGSHTLLFSSVTHGTDVTDYILDDVSIVVQTATGTYTNHVFEGITVYPNPAKEKIYVNINAPVVADYEISIYNIEGQKVYNSFEKELQYGKIEIPTLNLAKGTYQLVINNNFETKVQRIVIE